MFFKKKKPSKTIAVARIICFMGVWINIYEIFILDSKEALDEITLDNPNLFEWLPSHNPQLNLRFLRELIEIPSYIPEKFERINSPKL